MSVTGVNRSKMIKAIMEMKKKNEELEEAINLKKMENFEYFLKCNRMENAIAKVESLIKNTPGKLVEVSKNTCDLLQEASGDHQVSLNLTRSLNRKSETANSPNISKVSTCNKAHVVKPHMVNGHILYIPTINLTRVSDLNALKSPPKNSLPETNAASCSSQRDAETDSDTLVETESPENEIGEASTSSSRSPSHSTVLSGTFQEVKIYLNQISPESLSEESRKLISKRRISDSPDTPRKSCRIKTHKGVTQRRKK